MASASDLSGIEVHGHLTCRFYRDDGTIFAEQLLYFAMQLQGANRWLLTSSEPSGDGSWERGCNGTNIFNLFRDHGEKSLNFAGFVDDGIVPSSSYPARIPWLAFASGAFLSTHSAFPAPWADARNDPLAHIYEVHVRFSDMHPGFPETIEWRVSAERIKAIPSNRWLADSMLLADRKLKPWFPNEPIGFLAARYRVMSLTNVFGIDLPRSFELSKYRVPVVRAAFTNFPLGSVFLGEISDVRKVQAAGILPDLPRDKPVHILDLRSRQKIPNVLSVRYTITNGQWTINCNDPALVRLFEAEKHRPLPGIVLAAICMAMVVPIIFLLRRNPQPTLPKE